MEQTSQISRKSAIRRALPITECGLTFYPITMAHYEIFTQCKDSLTIRLSSLPVKYLTKNYLSALFSLEIDSVTETGKSSGIFQKLIRLLYLSLRIEITHEKVSKSIYYTMNGDDINLEYIVVDQNGESVKITPRDFSSKILRIIAEQNGVELPDQSENIDLVKSNEQLKELKQQSQKLKVDVNDLIASVAYNSRVSEKEIDTWTIREFEARRNAIERDKKFMLYGQAEMGGMVSFKEGNPYPSWCFDTIDDSLGGISMSSFKEKISGGKDQTT